MLYDRMHVISLGSIVYYGLGAILLVSVLTTWLQHSSRDETDAKPNENAARQQQQQQQQDEEPSRTESPLGQIARVFAPSMFAFNRVFFRARGRRTLVFFPRASGLGCSLRSTFLLLFPVATNPRAAQKLT